MGYHKAVWWLVVGVFAAALPAAAETESVENIRTRLAAASSKVYDLQGTIFISPASRTSAGKISKGVLQFLDQGFREVKISFKSPDKYRAEGKARGIQVIYVTKGNTRQIIAPALMLKTTENLEHEREKKQSTLDVGFASDLLWNDNRVKLLSVDSKGVAELQLVPIGARDKRKELIWLDTKSLKVLKRERYGAGANLKARHIYLNHRLMAGMPVATLVKAYAPDGSYAGSMRYENIRVNIRLADSLFAIK